MKICTKCHKEYPATAEYFYRDNHLKNGLCSQCKFCKQKYIHQYRLRHQQELQKYNHKYYRTINGYLRTVYKNINHRCNNSKNKRYKDYGGRGIKNKFASSQEFVDYVMFELKIDPRGLQIDRINNDGHYELGNIQFVTAKENCNNKRQRK